MLLDTGSRLYVKAFCSLISLVFVQRLPFPLRVQTHYVAGSTSRVAQDGGPTT